MGKREYFIEVLKKFPYERTKYGSTPLEVRIVIFIKMYNGKENRSGIMGLFFQEYDQNTALEVAR